MNGGWVVEGLAVRGYRDGPASLGGANYRVAHNGPRDHHSQRRRADTHQTVCSSAACPRRPPKDPALDCRRRCRLVRAGGAPGETCTTSRVHLRCLLLAFGGDWLAEGESARRS